MEQGLTARSAFITEFFEPSSRRRRRLADEIRAGRLSIGDVQLDLLTLLYVHSDESWPDGVVLQETIAYMVGAAQTTSQALPLLVIQLEGWLRDHPEHRPLVTADPDFLRRAAGESLRFFVAAPARVRIAVQDVVLPSTGRLVAADQRVALYFRPANADSALFGDDAPSFNPLRRTSGAPYGLAFGAGVHICPGKPVVVGYGDPDAYEGTLVTLARALYTAGLELDPELAPVPDRSTHYDAYASVPIRLHLDVP
jgi:cytochrome P450